MKLFFDGASCDFVSDDDDQKEIARTLFKRKKNFSYYKLKKMDNYEEQFWLSVKKCFFCAFSFVEKNEN